MNKKTEEYLGSRCSVAKYLVFKKRFYEKRIAELKKETTAIPMASGMQIAYEIAALNVNNALEIALRKEVKNGKSM